MQNENNTEITLIENEIHELVNIVELKPAEISFNFEKLNEKIKDMVGSVNIHFDVNNNIDKDKTDFVVDYQNRKQSKQTYQFLNTISKNIDTVFKGKIKEAIAPVDKFKEDTKKSLILIQSAVAFIQIQTKAHEEQLKLMCKDLLLLELNRLCLLHKLDIEYQDRIDINDLANLTNLNAEHEEAYITKKAKEGVEAKVNKMLLMQSQVATRLASLKDYSINAGLVSPLTREDINCFIEDTDTNYHEKLSALVNKEINRQNATIKALELKEAQLLKELREPVVNEPTKQLQTKKYRYCITASYEIESDLDITVIKNNYEQKCKNMAPNTFKNITINAI